ncbi:MAG: TolC family protein [Taibaiella sp.]|nr:TolC family protein [Taibaiella sp.]
MLLKKVAYGLYATCCICLLHTNVIAQTELPVADTISLNFTEAQKMFLDKNLSLLAEHYNIQSSKALVEQARKWDNPSLNTDQNVYRKGDGFFKHGVSTDGSGNVTPQGEIFVQVSQLIKTAGKRGKQINLANTNVNLADWQFKSVMRNLRATLVKDFYTIAQLQSTAQLYSQNMERLGKLQTGMEAQLKAGNIARKEYLRIQALIVSLQQDMLENQKNLSDNEAELKTMLQVTGNTFIKPVADDSESADISDVAMGRLIDTARLYNTDYQQELYQLQYQKQNLSLQKALAYPDFTVAPEFDQSANYAPNYFGLTLSLPLPVWDRNQGNIKSVKYLIKKEEAEAQMASQKLQNDVLNAYQKLLFTIKLTTAGSMLFYNDYYKLQQNIIQAYNDRQISLLEFLDYFGDYKDVRQKQLQQTLNLRLAKEELNDVVGIDIIK